MTGTQLICPSGARDTIIKSGMEPIAAGTTN